MQKNLNKSEAKRKVKKFSEELKKNNFPFKAVYLFGSYARDRARKWSDIDVAVISEIFKRNRPEKELILWKLRRKIDSMIEPIGFTVEDFKDDRDPMVAEIKETGIRVA
ncbi:MAG: nucleotidyltransferase domain-containing protein [Patescibacteria group bacterium]|jgi:predicted nucleotidyltransferase